MNVVSEVHRVHLIGYLHFCSYNN